MQKYFIEIVKCYRYIEMCPMKIRERTYAKCRIDINAYTIKVDYFRFKFQHLFFPSVLYLNKNLTSPRRHWAMEVRRHAKIPSSFPLAQISTNKLLAILGMNECKSYSTKKEIIMANCLPLWLRIEFCAARHNLSFAQMLELDIIWLLFFPLNTNEGRKIVHIPQSNGTTFFRFNFLGRINFDN